MAAGCIGERRREEALAVPVIAEAQCFVPSTATGQLTPELREQNARLRAKTEGQQMK